jgi:glycosyltransferase involved in cell wall biosynthesis
MRTGQCSGPSPLGDRMTANRPAVIFLMRKELPDYYSIERLFKCVEPYISKSFDVRVVRVPCTSSGILQCLRNLAFTARQRADVIHVTGDIHYCAMAVWRNKCVLTIHDLCSLQRLKGVKRLVFSILWYSLPLRWAQYVTVISEATRNQLDHTFPATAGKAEVILNCVDEAFWLNRRIAWSRADKPCVLQVGTGWNKNLERVAMAISGLPVRLRIIGALSDDQQSLLRSLDLEWTATEQLSWEAVMREYQESEILMFASTYEGFGLPIVEAQAAGLPVITSGISPMTEVAGDAALFVDPFDEIDIRSALERLLRSPGLARRLSDLGRRNAKRFDAKTTADYYANVYGRICRSHAEIREKKLVVTGDCGTDRTDRMPGEP